MPETLGGLARVFHHMQTKHRVMVQALKGSYAPDESDVLIEEIESEADALSALLRDPEICRMSWVTLPEPMAVEETADAAAALSQAGIPLQDVIVNRVTLPPPRPCGWCDGRRYVERQAIATLKERLPEAAAIAVTSRTKEPRGVSVLATIGEEIAAGRPIPSSRQRMRRAGMWSAESAGKRVIAHSFAGSSTRLVLFGGKGGVGKTTCAAAAALAIAADAPSRPVHLLSTDPAHSLGDVLGHTIGNDLIRLRGAPKNLFVREIDAARQFDEIRARYASSIEALFDRFVHGGHSGVRLDLSQDRAVLHGLIDLAPPGIDELAAVIDVVDAVDSDATSLIVMDTAPSGHALRLLEMPGLVQEWTKALMSILLKYRSLASLEDMGPVLLKLSQGLGRLRALLADADRTSFIAVARGAELPRQETVDLMRRLDALGLHVSAVIVNAVGRGSCSRCRSEAAAEGRHIARLEKDIPRTAAMVIAPAQMPPPNAPAALRRWQALWYVPR